METTVYDAYVRLMKRCMVTRGILPLCTALHGYTLAWHILHCLWATMKPRLIGLKKNMSLTSKNARHFNKQTTHDGDGREAITRRSCGSNPFPATNG